MFGDPREWAVSSQPLTTIGELAVSVTYGTSTKAGHQGRWPILRMGNVTDAGRIDSSDLKYIDLTDAEVPRYTVRQGDMLFNRTNSKEKVGKSAVVRTVTPFAIAGYLVRVRFETQGYAEFVSTYLNSAHGRAVRRSLAKAAVNQANISASQMRKITIAIPPSSLVAAFGIRQAQLERNRERLTQMESAESRLFFSLQSRAFRGEL